MAKTYWQTILDLWDNKDWISNEDYRIATGGSPKFTSRISDMRKKGVEIVGARRGKYNVYRLDMSRKYAEKLMKTKKSVDINAFV